MSPSIFTGHLVIKIIGEVEGGGGLLPASPFCDILPPAIRGGRRVLTLEKDGRRNGMPRIAVLGLVLSLGWTGLWALEPIPHERQKNLREYFEKNDKFANVVDKPLELLQNPKFSQVSKQYLNALLMVRVANEVALTRDFEAFKLVIEELDKKLLEHLLPRLANVLGWFSWARTGMELFKSFVWDPALESLVIDEYCAARDALLEPADAFAKLHQFGQMRLAAIDRLRSTGELSDLAFVEGSKDQLLPRWEENLMRYANAWFECQYQDRLYKKALAALAAEKGKAEAELAALDGQLLEAMKDEGSKDGEADTNGDPSPASNPQEWSGHWKGRAKSSSATGPMEPVVMEQETELYVTRGTGGIRLSSAPGGDGPAQELAFTPGNPNAAFLKKSEKAPSPVGGVADTSTAITAFIRDGRLYYTFRVEVSVTSDIPDHEPITVKSVTDTVAILDRVP